MALEIRQLSPEWSDGLTALFAAIRKTGESQFHPHPFTAESAGALSRYRGKDLYYLLADSPQVIGYGMLRGWDEGYEIPSLGIILHPEHRGKRLGELLMNFLHAAARARGAHKVRLKVYAENKPALAMYRKLGYRFDGSSENGQLVGVVEL